MKLMHHPFALIAAALLCLQPVAHAAAPTTNTTRRPQPERWLLVVDTSNAMERRAKAVEGVVGELLLSGMKGQMEPGAEFGIWTYNKELYAGVAPRQTWEPARSNLITSRTISFLGQQNYRSKGKLEPVMAGVSHVVDDSRQLTVVWLSDGTQKIAGTPFDDEINGAFTNHRPALAKTRMPLVTVLRAYHGKYIGQNVSVAPWPVEFPAFPIDPEKTNVLAKPAVAKPTEPVKSIYISSPKKPAADQPAAVETQGGSVKLRPLPESGVPDVVPQSKPVEPVPVPPLPVTTTEPAPVVAPVEPALIIKPIEPAPESKVVELAVAEPPPTVPAASTPSPALAVSSPTPVVPAPQVAIATNTVTARKWPLILGIGFMWAAIAVALLLARRARRANATSLITRSFDRDQK